VVTRAPLCAGRQVWASAWNERASIACGRAGLGLKDVSMAVLIQKVVESEYAFVVHTANPLTRDRSEMYAEVVVGQGEALVGNSAGRAMGFSCPKDLSAPPKLLSMPSKGLALHGAGIIFRSDSNSEDLPDFSGAGLFDSVPMVQHTVSSVAYRENRLVTDPAFAESLMKKVHRTRCLVP
jgi:alpha-glucan,water dikinase